MKYYKEDGKTSVGSNKPEEITLESALQEIDQLPDEEIVDDNFIGFINGKETVQFIRREKDNWFLDAPILENGKFSHSLQETDLTTEKVKNVVKKFYSEENWKSLCTLK